MPETDEPRTFRIPISLRAVSCCKMKRAPSKPRRNENGKYGEIQNSLPKLFSDDIAD